MRWPEPWRALRSAPHAPLSDGCDDGATVKAVSQKRLSSVPEKLRQIISNWGPVEWTLVAAGIVLRVVASLAYWPTIPSNADSWPYAYYAGHDIFGDPQHPAGYSLFLAIVGLFTRNVAAFTVLQHLLGIATALAMFAAVRRLSGSPWPGVVAAAFVLLNADQVYQENQIVSEWLFTLLWALGLYATARTIDARTARWRWAIAAGVLTGLAVVVRTQGALLIPVFALGVLLSRPRPWRAHWRSPVALLLSGCVVLLGYGTAKALDTGEFQIGPSPGWQLYAHVAPFADCALFTPPRGTAKLCETIPPSEREGDGHYLYDPSSPAVALWGKIGNHDNLAMSWALAVIEAQPGEYLRSVWGIMRDYYVPGTFKYVPGAGDDIDSELSWKGVVPPTAAATVKGMESFFDPFHPTAHPRRQQALYDYQRVFRLGATLLTICSLLTVLALCVGPRRTRVCALVLGCGAVLTLVPQAAGGAYVGRYSVPLSGSMGASAAVAIMVLYRMERQRRAHLSSESGAHA